MDVVGSVVIAAVLLGGLFKELLMRTKIMFSYSKPRECKEI